MRLKDERIILTVGLVPFILCSVFVGQILGEALNSFLPHIPAWVQPPDGNRVIDMRVSESNRLDWCAVLAQMENHQVYLYTIPDSNQQTMEAINVTDSLPHETLPQAFAVKSLRPLQLEISDSPQNKWTIETSQYLGVPIGKIVTSGRCFHWIELFTEDLNAVLVDGRGLWIAWRSGDSLSGSNERRTTLSVLGIGAITIVAITGIYRFIWRK